jgi:hypothetical protein
MMAVIVSPSHRAASCARSSTTPQSLRSAGNVSHTSSTERAGSGSAGGLGTSCSGLAEGMGRVTTELSRTNDMNGTVSLLNGLGHASLFMPRDGLDVLLEKIGMLQLRLRRRIRRLGTIGYNHLLNPKYNSPRSRYTSRYLPPPRSRAIR